MKRKLSNKQILTLLYANKHLNIVHIADLQAQLYPLITQRNKEVVLDLRHVLFMDCCAVGCIISMHQVAQANHTLLTLSNLKGNVKLLTETLKLSRIINIRKENNPNIHNVLSNDSQFVKCCDLF